MGEIPQSTTKGNQVSESQRQQRRSYSIHAFVGANGGGKTLAAVHTLIPSLLAGRQVLSTVRLRDPLQACRKCEVSPCSCGLHDYPDHPFYVPLRDYKEVLEAEHCDLLFDEVVGLASSRESQSMPVQVSNILHQLRRRDVTLFWTGVSWARADKVIREASQAVTDCRGFIGERQEGRVWTAKRMFHWRTYDAKAFEEFTAAKRQKLKPVCRDWHVRSWNDAQYYYDTLEAVATLGWASDAGLCMACGGKRTIKRCTCPR